MLNYNFYLRNTQGSDSFFTNGTDHVLYSGDWYQVYPGVNRDISKVWTKEDGFRWRETLNGELWFTNRNANGALRSDYTILSQITSLSCEVEVRIEQVVGTTTASDWWSGFFSIKDGKWDNDRGVVIITPAPDDEYRDLYGYGELEYNLISELSPEIAAIIDTSPTVIEIQSACTSLGWSAFQTANAGFPAAENKPGDNWDNYAVCEACIPPGGAQPTDIPPGYINEDCPECASGTWKYTWYKQVSPFRVTDDWVWDATEQAYALASCIAPSSTITLNGRGFLLNDAISHIVNDIAGLSFKSTFINNDDYPNGDPGGTSNYVLDITAPSLADPNPLNNLVMYQKSDIKTTTDPATNAPATFNELMSIIRDSLNAYWFIDSNGDFRIEHYSYFAKTVDTDLADIDSGKWINAKYKYEYDIENMPSREHFEWMEANGEDFVGTDIVYDKIATGNNYGDSQKDRSLLVTTDINYAYSNQSDISNEGWILLQTDGSPDYTIGNEVGELSGDSVVNGHLSWANLHEHYWKHGRVLSVGSMNYISTTFSDYQRNIKQIEITYPVGASDFNPNYLKTTQIGDGEVGSAEYRLLDGTVKTVFFYPNLKGVEPPPAESYLVKTSDIWHVLANNIDKIKWYG